MSFPGHQNAVRISLILFAAFTLLSCAGPRPLPPRTIPPKKARPMIDIRELEKAIHARINRERRERGLSPLAWNSTLGKVARKHSLDMARRSYFSHYSPEGHDFSYRYGQEGYACSLPVKDRIYMGAENIFQNNLYDRIVYVNGAARYDWNSADRIAETTVKGWMNSPGHRKNILTPYWKSEGIGIAVSPDDRVYITENFC